MMKKQQYFKVIFLVFTFLLASFGEVLAQTTTRVSISSNGDEGDNASYTPSISADGRYVSFASDANNLVEGDTNGVTDIFVHDQQTGETQRVSVSSGGTESDGASTFARITSDGRYVVFHSDATNLVVGDTNGSRDIFLHDRQTDETMRISVSSSGIQGNGDSAWPNRISADSRYVAFASDASNLVEGDTNGVTDIFVHDQQTGETTRVSVSTGGTESDGASGWGTISSNSRYVTFYSEAANLVENDVNGALDVFIHDRETGETKQISVSSSGSRGNRDSDQTSISSDGRFVAFRSDATNLVVGDMNEIQDIFVHDQQTGETTRASVSSDGTESNGYSERPNTSSDGRYVTFYSEARNLVAGDTNEVGDIFIHDRNIDETIRVSISSSGTQANNRSFWNYTSLDGQFVTFASEASNLVEGDSNGVTDIFVYERAPDHDDTGDGDNGSTISCFIKAFSSSR
jgi:hypothetical protein